MYPKLNLEFWPVRNILLFRNKNFMLDETEIAKPLQNVSFYIKIENPIYVQVHTYFHRDQSIHYLGVK